MVTVNERNMKRNDGGDSGEGSIPLGVWCLSKLHAVGFRITALQEVYHGGLEFGTTLASWLALFGGWGFVEKPA
jgi:hypothetical protein